MSERETEFFRSVRSKRRKRKVKASRLFLLVLALIAASIVLVGCGYVAEAVFTIPAWDPSKLTGSQSTIIYDKYDKPASQIYAEENRSPVSLEELPPYLPEAFISAEDVRFYSHHGIDLRGIARAVVANIRGGLGSEGASTITQQLVRTSFLSQEKVLKRKIQEAILAVEVEQHYTKDQILELYLNRIYYGNGAYGIEAASELYFNKPARSLDLAESAMLAGIVRSPNNYNPFASYELAKQRQATVLDQMVKYGKISAEEAQQAKEEQLKLHEGPIKSSYNYPYYTDQVISEAEKVLMQQGMSRESSQNLIYRGGLKIYTSLNTKAQKKMEEVFANSSNFPADQQGNKVQAAMVLLDQHNGEIQALIGGRQYTQQRPFNRATQAKRQPGSAIKPIAVYAPALEKGYTTATVFDDVPATFGSKTFYNYDNRYRGLITMRTAVQYSINTYAVQLLNRLGIDYGYEFCKRLGITSLDPVSDRNLSLALGGVTYGISPLEMAGAYGAIANQGIYIQPHSIRKIVDSNGDTIYEAHPQKRVVMSKQTAYIMTDLLQSVVKAGTGTPARLNRPTAGKTGTTSNDVDAWFMGYTPEYVGGVWMGFDQEKHMVGVYGSSYPARIWKAVMQAATEGLPVRDFPQPSGLVRATICSKSGKLPNAFCPDRDLIQELFVQGTVPTDTCDAHVQAEICADSGQLATPNCPNKIQAVFLKRSPSKVAEDAREALPTGYCTIHSSSNYDPNQEITLKVCTDPRHNGTLYLANVPGLLEQGGCPPEFVEERTFKASEAPKLYCSLPDHQVKKSDLSLRNLLNQGKKRLQGNQEQTTTQQP